LGYHKVNKKRQVSNSDFPVEVPTKEAKLTWRPEIPLCVGPLARHTDARTCTLLLKATVVAKQQFASENQDVDILLCNALTAAVASW